MMQTIQSLGTSAEVLIKVGHIVVFPSSMQSKSLSSGNALIRSHQGTARSELCIDVMCAAFAVASLEQAELRLKHFNIEFHKFLVPGTNASQIFLYDPEG